MTRFQMINSVTNREITVTSGNDVRDAFARMNKRLIADGKRYFLAIEKVSKKEGYITQVFCLY